MPVRWKVLAVAFFARTGLGFQFQSLAAVAPDLTNKLGIGHSDLGFLIGLFMLAGVFLSIPAGLFGRIYPDRTLIILGIGLLALGALIGALGNTFVLLGVGRVVCGIGFVLGTLFFVKLISEYFDGKELATALGILVMSWPVGIAVAQVLLPWLAGASDWNTALLFTGAWNLCGVVLVWCFIPAKSQSVADLPVCGDSGRSREVEYKPETIVGDKTRHRFGHVYFKLTLLAALVWGVFNAGFAVYLSFINERLSELGYPERVIGILASIPGWIMPVSAIIVGLYADRSGKKDLIIYSGMFAAVVSMLLLAAGYAVWFALILFGVLGASCAGVIMSLSSEAMPADERAFGMGIFFTLYFVVNLPAPAVAGWLLDRSGSAIATLSFAAILFALTALGAWVFRRNVEPVVG